MELATEKDLPFMQEILDLPEIQEGMRGGLDLQVPPASVFLEFGPVALFETGFFSFIQLGEKTYEVHTVFRPDGNLIAKLRRAREALRWLFTHTLAEEVVTQIGVHNHAARMLAERASFVEIARTERQVYYRLDLVSWLYSDPHMAFDGQILRERLQTHNVALLPFLGFLTHAVASGLAPKGVELLGRYAILYGIPSLRVESWSPLSLSLNGHHVLVS